MMQPEMKLQVLFCCGHFDRTEISFCMTKFHVNTTRNEITGKKTSTHALFSSKQESLAFIEWTVFLGPPRK